MKHSNPLQKYFRRVQGYITLPSKGVFYSPNIIEIDTETNEIPIMAMTGKDEIGLKNPEGLLNGESLKNLLSSCVVGLKKPTKLLTMDIEAMLASIRLHSFGKEMEIGSKCPKCNTENNNQIDLELLLEDMKYIDQEFPVTLKNNLTVFLKPFTFECNLKANLANFEHEKIVKRINNMEVEDPGYLKNVSIGIENLGNLNFDLLVMCIDKIIDEDSDINLKNNNKEHEKWIKEFLFNITREEAEALNDKLVDINKSYGLKKEFRIECQNEDCKEIYDIPMNLDPSTFFLQSLEQTNQTELLKQ